LTLVPWVLTKNAFKKENNNT